MECSPTGLSWTRGEAGYSCIPSPFKTLKGPGRCSRIKSRILRAGWKDSLKLGIKNFYILPSRENSSYCYNIKYFSQARWQTSKRPHCTWGSDWGPGEVSGVFRNWGQRPEAGCDRSGVEHAVPVQQIWHKLSVQVHAVDAVTNDWGTQLPDKQEEHE